GGDRDDLAEDRHAGAEVAAVERRVGVAPQRRDGPADGAGVLLDLDLELGGGGGEGLVLEGLVGSARRDGGKGSQRGEDAGAKKRAHLKTSPTTLLALMTGAADHVQVVTRR